MWLLPKSADVAEACMYVADTCQQDTITVKGLQQAGSSTCVCTMPSSTHRPCVSHRGLRLIR